MYMYSHSHTHTEFNIKNNDEEIKNNYGLCMHQVILHPKGCDGHALAI